MLRSRRYTYYVVAALLSIASPAVAEVMDKEPKTHQIWQWALALAVLAFLIGRYLPVLGLGLMFLPNVPLGVMVEIADSSVGPYIATEAGSGYLAQVYAANLLWISAYIVGLVLWLRARGRKRRAETPTA